jgi:hypothetical protein
MLRQFWSLVETTQSSILLDLDDASLVQWLLRQIKSERSLNLDEAAALNTYIRSRLPLIRDLAYSRLARTA